MGGPSDYQKFQKASADDALTKLPGMAQQFNQQAGQNSNAINTGVQLNTDYSAKPGLDRFSQGLLSQGQQQVARNLGATQAGIAQKFSGPLASTLQSQAAMQSRLNSNPLMFNVAAQQVGRQQQEQQLGNNAMLAQQGANNQALATKTSMQALPMAAQQSLVQSLQSGYKK